MNNKYKFLLITCISIFLVGCDPMCLNYVKIYVNNNTDKRLVLFEEFPKYASSLNLRDTISANEVNLLLSSYVEGPITAPIYKYEKIWIYNPIDSTYIINANYSLNNKENAVIDNKMTQNRNGKDKNNNNVYNTDFVFNIDNSLLSKMVKNTHLTDSIFKLKR